MTAKVAEGISKRLADGFRVLHRCTTKVKKRPCRLHFETATKVLLLDYDAEDEEAWRVPLREVSGLRAKDYTEGHRMDFGITFAASGGEEQHCLLFQDLEARNLWLRQLEEFSRKSDAGRAKSVVVSTLESSWWVVQSVEIADPALIDKDAAVRLKLKLFHPNKPLKDKELRFRRGQSMEACRAQISEFQKANELLATEGSSIYRLVKSLMARDQIKDEVQRSVDRINELNFKQLIQDAEQASTVADLTLLRNQARKELEALKRTLPEKFGDGTGPRILGQILTRSVEKLELLNDRLASKYMDEVTGDTPKSSRRVGRLS